MIEGEREYKITREQVRVFKAALDDAERAQTTADPLIQKAIIESIASQLETLQRELYEYEHGIAHQKEPVGIPEVLLGVYELARGDVVTAFDYMRHKDHNVFGFVQPRESSGNP